MTCLLRLTAAANSYSESNGGYYDANAVMQSVEAGAALGSQAYSQSYELESDTLGTRITAAAGYDPVKGAMFFARPEAAKTTSGKLSFYCNKTTQLIGFLFTLIGDHKVCLHSDIAYLSFSQPFPIGAVLCGNSDIRRLHCRSCPGRPLPKAEHGELQGMETRIDP